VHQSFPFIGHAKHQKIIDRALIAKLDSDMLEKASLEMENGPVSLMHLYTMCKSLALFWIS